MPKLKTRIETSYADLVSHYRLMSDGDTWGSCMEAWFAVAAEMHFRDPDSVPHDWRYSPSCLRWDDPRERESMWLIPLRDTSDETLHKFGAVLNRLAAKLKQAGKDY